MKLLKSITFIFLIISSNKGIAQSNQTIEKSIFGIETGLLGLWANNESRLVSNLSLKSELGLDAGIFGGGSDGETGIVLVPAITLEPRYYYNIRKRALRHKNTANNSANFLALNLKY